MSHTGSDFPSYHSVAILKMPRFPGERVRSWLDLHDDQVRQVFDVVKSFHEVNTEGRFNLCNSDL